MRSEHDPGAFLDRDGVINVDIGYPHRPEDFRFIEGAPEAIRQLNRHGYKVIVVTNQSGVARGLFDEAAVEHFHNHMCAELARHDAFIDAIYMCPYHPDGQVERYRADHPDRKPGPGMILRAQKDYHIDLSRSFMIGDKESDMKAAQAAGVPGYLFKGGNLVNLIELILKQIGRPLER
ncbi:D-glycero-alpha-D-manno-heptose-1,7-bisphosphate 7-phosphatase [Komagataeibacter europaeus]|uniref:D,D-heptose 1,7-bisphosphate phosphatase n=1 Tax=Komagataeibacter europaeus TaxID=33995 RepID=A0A0M0EG65_KOMEU|nr:HAD family hydrolase [Komagataeibacter europaeus]KON64240.1 D-glycero-alpha-D-manno-heptose-1,7-bisphosphate 7-phosphatase [Komagataeibacter europaeus]